MEKPRTFIRWEDGYHLFGNLVVGRFRLPLVVPAALSGVWLAICLVGGFIADMLDPDTLLWGLAFFIMNLTVVGGVWLLVGIVLIVAWAIRIIKDVNR